ncbi:hypothetical protein scyTo_0005228 [Scyliorhinus torazame]|uniref:Uncharacterized protein n=1 Tax=Scyliorhinus torazame TaxID=75743 RepID=A0A401P491_SCYTO|nr:hypothetical protein [Scyliorhinus torazame]
MAEVVGPSAIVAASKVNGKAAFFLRAERVVHLALEKGLMVGGIYLAVDPLEATAERVILSHVPHFIPTELLLAHLHQLGEVRSEVIPLPLGLKDPTLKHIFSFRLQVFVCLAREEVLEGTFEIPFGDKTYRICWSAGGVRHHACKKVKFAGGHNVGNESERERERERKVVGLKMARAVGLAKGAVEIKYYPLKLQNRKR